MKNSKTDGPPTASPLQPTRQPAQTENQAPGYGQKVFQSTAHQLGQGRPFQKTADSPCDSQVVRSASLPNMQAARHNLQQQNTSQQPASGSGQQQNVQKIPQQQQLLHSGSASLSKGLSIQAVRSATRLPLSTQSQSISPAQDQELSSQNQMLKSGSMTPRTSLQPQSLAKPGCYQHNLPREPQQQPTRHQSQFPHGQNVMSTDRAQDMAQSEYDEYYDDDSDEDQDDDDIHFQHLPGTYDYSNYLSDDDEDELSEEEAALLEELRYCTDDIRHREIINRLEEKGVDPEEVKELLYHCQYGQDFNSDHEEGDNENEAGGMVLPPPHGQIVLKGSATSDKYNQPVSSQRQQNMAHPIQMHSPGSKETSSQNMQVFPPDRIGQQRKIPGSHDLHFPAQKQDPVLQQRQGYKQQPEMKHIGHQRKVFQSNPSQADPGQPPQNVVKTQRQRGDEDPSEKNVESPNTSQVKSTSSLISQVQTSLVKPPMVTSLKSLSQQSSPAGTSQVLPPKTVLHSDHKPRGPQDMTGNPKSYQQQEILKPMKPGTSSSPEQQQNVLHFQLKAAAEKSSVPSGANLARLNVELMQQSLDQEIMAKKGSQPSPGNELRSQNADFQPLMAKNRFRLSHPNIPTHRHSLQALRQKQQTIFQAYRPKHQLPVRQPIPAIVNPNSSTNKMFSSDRPVCSVTPFTSDDQGETVSAEMKKLNTPLEREPYLKPRNITATFPQESSSDSLQGAFQIKRATSSINSTQQPTSTVAPQSGSTGVAHSASIGAAYSANISTAKSDRTGAVHSTSSGTAQSSSLGAPQSISPDTPQTASLEAPKSTFPGAPQATNVDTSKSSTVPGALQSTSLVTSKSSTILGAPQSTNLDTPKSLTIPGAPQSTNLDASKPAAQGAQQSAVLGAKNDAFSVDQLSKDKCIVTGKGKNQNLVVNMVYQIKSPIDGSIVLALWNGEKFENLKQPGCVARQSDKSGSDVQKTQTAPAGTVSKNATESSSGVETQARYSQEGSNEQKQISDVSSQCAIGSASTSQIVSVKSSADGQTEQKSKQVAGQIKNDDNESNLFKKPLVESDKHCRVCPYCGFKSKNLRRCESCSRVFRGDVKIYSLKKQPSGSSTVSGSMSGPTSTTPWGSLQEEDMESEEFDDIVNSACETPHVRSQSQGVFGRTSVRNNIEDDDVDQEGNKSSGGPGKRYLVPSTSQNPTPIKRFKRAYDSERPGGDSAGELATSIPGHSEDRRMDRMHQSVQPTLLDMPEDEDEEEFDDEEDDDDGENPMVYDVDIRSVRVGSMRTQPEGPMLINLEGVCLKVRSERTDEIFECEILAHEVQKIKYFYGETQPVLFLFLTQESGKRLRAIFHMAEGDDEFFDPNGSDMKEKMIVIIIECFNYLSHEMLRETLSLWADLNQVDDRYYIEELTEESSNDLLIQSAPPVLDANLDRDFSIFQARYDSDYGNMVHPARRLALPFENADNEPDSTSSSPPDFRHHYYGSPIRLLQYPPPPAKRLSITTEDLFCLTEGEFLNDVIIDFYLQYLYHERLSEEDKRRTHIFSSFFYKRLTQRDRHCEKSEEDAKKSLPERRHARVKKWTKTVDLFSKDFIIIPINEHSHWYLAVICFPGLSGPEFVPFIPNPDHMEDLDSESSDASVILGQQLDGKKYLDKKDNKYKIGQKQPCILIFDSLAGPSRTPNIKILQDYLQCEWSAKKSEPNQITKILKSCTPRVPQQNNFSDCGVYVLQYVESFFEDPIADFQIPMNGLEHWFPEELVDNKRREIHELIMNLHRRFQEERGDPNILDLKFECAPRERFYPVHDPSSSPEEDMSSGLNRDDDNSNSTFSTEMSRNEPVVSAVAGSDGENQNNVRVSSDRQKSDENSV